MGSPPFVELRLYVVRSDGLPWSNIKDAKLSISKGLKGQGDSESPGERGVGSNHTYLEDHPRTSKWLGSPLFIRHEKPIWKGNNSILRGLKRSPWLLTTYKSWDDPPSSNHP